MQITTPEGGSQVPVVASLLMERLFMSAIRPFAGPAGMATVDKRFNKDHADTIISQINNFDYID